MKNKLVCEVCLSDKYSKVYIDNITSWEYEGVFKYLKCNRCGIVYSPTAPSYKERSKYYSKDYWGKDIENFNDYENWKSIREKYYGYLYKDIFKYKKKGKILDIGCGSGLFLSKFKELGWEVDGTDVSFYVKKVAKEYFGVNVLMGDFPKLRIKDNNYDVISLNHVLEHLENPYEHLKQIRKKLKNDGLLVIGVPNIDSLGFKLYRKDWYPLQPGRHLYQFSPNTLSTLLTKAGFKIIKIKHGYYEHNYHSLFESFRFKFSPKFKKNREGGLMQRLEERKRNEKSISIEIGKIIVKLLATLVARLGSLMGKGEVIVAYAKK